MTNTTLATIAATTRATRFWVGTNAAGDIAQFWTAEPTAEDHPALAISAHVVMPLGSNGAPAGFEPIAASADQAAGVVPAELTDAQREQVRDAVAQALTGIYYCGRVWSAWQVGTMGEDDFTPAAEVNDVLTEITDAAINAITLAASAAPATSDKAEGK